MLLSMLATISVKAVLVLHLPKLPDHPSPTDRRHCSRQTVGRSAKGCPPNTKPEMSVSGRNWSLPKGYFRMNCLYATQSLRRCNSVSMTIITKTTSANTTTITKDVHKNNDNQKNYLNTIPSIRPTYRI